ncbi:hypothetical protein [Eggerthella hominis]|uniref:hypothetical protein n=1 Tax=Eggerthella hominis TaxID=2763043 RepID=UPI002101DC40|nr:hypothetical protein [Eggerthella hominis]
MSCVLAGFALCLHADNLLLSAYAIEGASDLFIHSFLAGVVVLCVVVFVSAHDGEKRRWSIGAGLLASVAGVLCALLYQVLPIEASAVGAGLFLGFGLTCLLRQWGRYYRLFSYQGALLNTMLAFLAASCWWFVVSHAGTPFLFCLGMLVLVSCGALPLLASQIVQADEIKVGLRSAVVVKPLETMREVMQKGWAAVAGLMFNFFTIGLTLWTERVDAGPVNVAFKPVAYLLLTVVVWWVVAHASRATDGILQVFYRVALPVSAALLLACPLVNATGALSGSMLFSVASYLGVALMNVLGLVVLLWMAKSSEVGFSKVFAAFCSSCAASVAAGMIAFQLFGGQAQLLWSSALSVYLVAMVLSEMVAAAGRRHGVCEAVRETVCEAGAEDELLDLVEELE